jgi:hypothetical protein
MVKNINLREPHLVHAEFHPCSPFDVTKSKKSFAMKSTFFSTPNLIVTLSTLVIIGLIEKAKCYIFKRSIYNL